MTSDEFERKRELRHQLRMARRSLSVEDAERQTASTVAACVALVERVRPPAVASYLAMRHELNLDALHREVWNSGLPLFVPSVRAPGRLDWLRFREGEAVLTGKHGISEPAGRGEELPDGTLLFVPGVGFSSDGHRLGQGLGFYDRFLERFRGCSVGVGFSCQLAEVPIEPHDQRLDGLVLGGETLLDPKSEKTR